MKALWRHLRLFKRQLVLLSFLGVVSAAANGFVPYITGRFFDTLIGVSRGELDAGQIPVWLSFFLAWVVIQLVANNADWVIDRLRRSVDIKLHLGIQAAGFIHLFHLPMSFHKQAKVNQVIELFSKAGWRSSAIVQTFVNIAPQFLGIIIGITLAASINVALAGILLTGVVLYVLLLMRILPPVVALDEVAHRAWSEGWGDAAEAAQQIESIKQATAEEYQSEKTRVSMLEKTYGLWYRLESIWSNVSYFQRIVVFATQSALFVASVYFIEQGIITVGELVALNGYALMFFGPFVALGHSWQTIQNGLTAAAQAERVFLERQEVYAPEGAVSFAPLKGSVKFENVSFQYGNGQPEILKDVSFAVKSGEIVALVGESGVGKSTIVSLISGYYFPSRGAVYVDDADTREFNLTSLRKQIAVVPQEIALFNDTIKENIRYGTFQAGERDIKDAAQKAHIDEFIETLPLQYETVVGERGVKLSVGQKQRVAIARAVLRDPRILILDEPTSALDSRTERYITESLEELMQGRTTFIIAHRLSTVRKADRILVFDKGRLVEEGTHAELMKINGGIYCGLYEHQIL